MHLLGQVLSSIAALVLLLSSSSLLLRAAASAAATDNTDPLISKFPALVRWFQEHGGTIDPRVTIGYEPPPLSYIRGTIASSDIEAETTIVHIPGSLAIKSVDDDYCASTKAVVDEIAKGQQSKWYDYFDFDDSNGSRLPLDWDRNGRAVHELQGLPPTGDTHSHLDFYLENCLGGSSEMSDDEFKAFKIVTTRACDIGIMPMYDLMNHHNGKINTYLRRDGDGGLYVIALTDIPAGMPIYNTYARSGWESTIENFNTYGFVEDYPQLWRWTDDDNAADHGLTLEDHTHKRYATTAEDYTPSYVNHHNHEVLILTPTLAALGPSKVLTEYLGNKQISLDEWENQIMTHHIYLRSSYVNDMHDSATELLSSLPTTVEEDVILLQIEKENLEKLKQQGATIAGGDMTNLLTISDVIQAIEYRIAYKNALTLVVNVANSGIFHVDGDEL